MRFSRFATTATLLLGSALAVNAAHAGGQVHWQLGIETPVVQLPGHVVLPLPPLPVPRVVVTTPSAGWHGGRDHRRWDADGDGIPNRHDRVYNPRWDRDGDGIPNRYDHVYNPRWDRDGDGIPNRHDRHPDGVRGKAHGQGPIGARPIEADRWHDDARQGRSGRDGRSTHDNRPNWREDLHRR